MENDASAEAEVRRRCELAWAAGFFDGEGWAGTTGPRSRRTKQPHAQINQAGLDGIPQTLTRFAVALGVGRLATTYSRPGARPMFCWRVSSRADVLATYAQLRPWLGAIKARQLEVALGFGSADVTERTRRDEEEERAWAAGLFDGEGCTSLCRHRSHAGYFIAEMSITQSGLDAVPEVLERFRDVIGAGRIYGPFASRSSKIVYRWKLYDLESQGSAVGLLSPWLGEIKVTQAREALAVVRAQPPLPRGRVEWGSHKTTCVHGHEYAVARVRPYRPRSVVGVERRASKQCLVCAREQAKARREARLATSSRSTPG